jgi:hypothetical protein
MRSTRVVGSFPSGLARKKIAINVGLPPERHKNTCNVFGRCVRLKLPIRKA